LTPRRFTDVFQVSAYALDDEQELTLMGSEEDLRQRTSMIPRSLNRASNHEQPNATRALASLISTALMKRTVDIYGLDEENVPVIAELKRRRVGPDAVGQLALCCGR
jgi:RecB family endonuclease NucS